MFCLRLLLLTAFLAQQLACCCGKGCGAPSVAGVECDHQHETQPASCTHSSRGCAHGQHDEHESHSVPQNVDEHAIEDDVETNGWGEAPENGGSHQHHLCVATHLFFIGSAPTTELASAAIDGLVLPAPCESIAVQGLSVALHAIVASSKDHGPLTDRAAIQVYLL
jgi:hypothetical protein